MATDCQYGEVVLPDVPSGYPAYTRLEPCGSAAKSVITTYFYCPCQVFVLGFKARVNMQEYLDSNRDEWQRN